MAYPPRFPLDVGLLSEQDQKLKGVKVSVEDVLRAPRRVRCLRITRLAPKLGWLLASALLLFSGTLLLMAFSKVTYQVLPAMLDGQIAESTANADPIGRWVAAPSAVPRVLVFSDGTRAVAQPGARLRVLDLGLRGASLVLETGLVELRVDGTRFTEYQVSVGPFHLTIPRGRVTATWNPMTSQLDLVVLEGLVVIAGCQFAEGRSVSAGKELGARCSEL